MERELAEELGISAPLIAGWSSNPLLVTQTTTVGVDAGHTDVSLWYVLRASMGVAITPDASEFAATRWWTFSELDAAEESAVDPHLPRFLGKLRRDLAHLAGR